MVYNLKRFAKHPQMRSIGLVFAMSSILFAFWITRLPSVKSSLGLSEGSLGFALFFMPLGGLTAMTLTHKIIRKWGEGKVSSVGIILHTIVMFLPLLAQNFHQLIIALFFAGFVGGIVGVAMNAVVSIIEKQQKIIFMATCHGCWSLGAMLGASVGSLMIGFGISPFAQMCLMLILVSSLILLFIGKNLWGIVHKGEVVVGKKVFSLPPAALMGLAFVGLCTMVGEGAIADWSAIFLEDVALAPDFISGFGYAAFAMSMTAGRFLGDNLTMRFGALRIIQIGSLIAISGILLIFPAIPALAIAGFGIVGLGYSCIVPVVFSNCANVPGIPPAQALASVASTAYIGFLVGPVAIGFIAEEMGLRISFLLIVCLQFCALLSAKRAMRVSGVS